MSRQTEPRCGYCNHVSVNNNNLDRMWVISGTIRTYLDGNKHYVRWCCYEAYVSGNQWWGSPRVRDYLKEKHPHPKISKILLLNGNKFIVYELKTKPANESIKLFEYIMNVKRSFHFNQCPEPHEVITNSEYKKRFQKRTETPMCRDHQSLDNESHYIYLLIEREFINTGEPIYKIGKTTQRNFARFKDYPKDSEVLLYLKCLNCHAAEKAILELFRKKYQAMNQYGHEYFKGDPHGMMRDICCLMIEN